MYNWDYNLPKNWQPKNDKEWEWYLTRVINYGLKKEKINFGVLIKYLPRLKIDPKKGHFWNLLSIVMKTILTDKQKIFLDEFEKDPDLPNIFYLTGGTALAEYYLHHRKSEDLDFFTDKEFDDKKLDLFIEKVKAIMKPKAVTRQRIYDRLAYIFDFDKELLKAEFVKYEFKNIKPEKILGKIKVADIYDIAINKLFTILDRNEAKDFVDLYYLLKKFGLNKLRKGVENKFGYKIDLIGIGGNLLKVKTIVAMPKMVKKLTKEQLVAFFEDQAYQLRRKIFNY